MAQPGAVNNGGNAGSSSSSTDAAIAKMEQAFNRAIEASARVTEIKQIKEAEHDASRQRLT